MTPIPSMLVTMSTIAVVYRATLRNILSIFINIYCSLLLVSGNVPELRESLCRYVIYRCGFIVLREHVS